MAGPIYLTIFETGLLGKVGLAVSQAGLLRVRMDVKDQGAFLRQNQAYQEGEYTFDKQATDPFRTQILEYLEKDRQVFSLAIDWGGYTAFQRAVLEATQAIPYGETRSYGEIAAAVGNPKAARAVGQAEKRNQVPLVIPCHRVIGWDGSLTGYGGSKNTSLKTRLISFEHNV